MLYIWFRRYGTKLMIQCYSANIRPRGEVIGHKYSFGVKNYCWVLLKTHSKNLPMETCGHSYFYNWLYCMCICMSFTFRLQNLGAEHSH